MKRVLLGMSGGVDSSTAIILLQKMGYEVVGLTFKFIEDYDPTDAIETAKKFSIEHHVLDYQEQFKKEVINRFLEDYKNGLTPNPCSICNKRCKFKYLFDNMEKYNCDYIATGHYAIIGNDKLYRGKDLNKDQSYFLYDLPKNKLNKIIFPLGNMTKEETRLLAKEFDLINANKKDSFDVCFIKTTFTDYITNNLKQEKGKVIDIDTNEVVGCHNGLGYYTIGQRRGLNIGGTNERMFVVGKDIKNNLLYTCIGEDNKHLYSDSCIINNYNSLSQNNLTKCTAKFRYRQKDVEVQLEYLNDNKVLVKFKDKQKRITPGQACVFYNNEQCLGGGIIEEVRLNDKKLWYV